MQILYYIMVPIVCNNAILCQTKANKFNFKYSLDDFIKKGAYSKLTILVYPILLWLSFYGI